MATFKEPANRVEAINIWYATMKQRVALEKEVRALKELEQKYESFLTTRVYPEWVHGNKNPIVGARCFVEFEEFDKVKLEDWPSFMSFVRASDGAADDLLYHRVAEDKTAAIIAAFGSVPGVVIEPQVKVSYRTFKK